MIVVCCLACGQPLSNWHQWLRKFSNLWRSNEENAYRRIASCACIARDTSKLNSSLARRWKTTNKKKWVKQSKKKRRNDKAFSIYEIRVSIRKRIHMHTVKKKFRIISFSLATVCTPFHFRLYHAHWAFSIPIHFKSAKNHRYTLTLAQTVLPNTLLHARTLTCNNNNNVTFTFIQALKHMRIIHKQGHNFWRKLQNLLNDSVPL